MLLLSESFAGLQDCISTFFSLVQPTYLPVCVSVFLQVKLRFTRSKLKFDPCTHTTLPACSLSTSIPHVYQSEFLMLH